MGVLYYFCNDVELLVFGMVDTAQKMKFPLRVSSVNVTKSVGNCGITFAEEILNGKLHLLCSVTDEKP